MFISFAPPKVSTCGAGKKGMKQLNSLPFFAVKARSFSGAHQPHPKVWF